MSSSLRRLLAVLLAIVTVFVSLAVVEGALEIREQRRLSREARRRLHPFLQVVPSPELYDHVNAERFRGDPIQVAKPAGVLRVFTLGGSTTLGVRNGYETTYPGILERLLRERFPERRIEVQNAASDWYTTAHTLVNYQLRVRRFAPDVVIAFEAINDLCRSFSPSWWAEGPFKADYSHYYGPLIRLRGLEAGFVDPPSANPLANLMIWRRARELFGAPSPYDVTPDGLRRLRQSLAPVPRVDFASLPSFRANLEALAAAIRDDGHTLVLASQPFLSADGLSADDRAKLLFGPVFCAESGTFPDDASMAAGLRRFNDASREIAAAKGVPFLDFEAAVPKNGTYFSDDVHMTAAANEILAKMALDWLVASPSFGGSLPRED
jgi:lysophospholipase L1-like esterase